MFFLGGVLTIRVFRQDPYYPVPNPDNQALFEKYKALAAKEPGVCFVGRLASYKCAPLPVSPFLSFLSPASPAATRSHPLRALLPLFRQVFQHGA